METIKITRHQSPAGEMIVGSSGDRLCICDWAEERHRAMIDRRICRYLKARYYDEVSDVAKMAMAQLDEYFAGVRREFTVPTLFTGTEFQRRVWSELMNIPYGDTISYLELACRIGNPKGVRAVASAVSTNPISIFVPCHRVIGSDRSLTGYGGGLQAKRLLLDLECPTM